MVLELEKPRVTELQVRMDCNGCVQKIKKAMHNVDGVYDIYIDFAQQKLTVIGRAELEKIIRAIKKTRKIATVCSHTDPNAPEPPPAAEPPADSQPPAADAAAKQPPSESPPAEATPPAEPPKDTPTPAPENPTVEVKPSPEANAAAPPIEIKDVEEIHMIHHHPHSFCSCKPVAYYVPEYGHHWPPALKNRYYGVEDYNDDYYQIRRGGDGNKITSVFSDENPNACTIV